MKRLFWTMGVVGAAVFCGSCILPGLPSLPSVIPSLRAPDASEVIEGAMRVSAAVDGATRNLRQRCDELKQQEIPLSEEVGLGGAVALNWMQTGGGLLDDYFEFDVRNKEWLPGRTVLAKPHNALNVYVATVGKNLAMQSSRPLLDWSFGVLDSENFNAFSAPGGYVMVTRGILRQVTSEAQLAGVLAHEISHVTQKHALVAYQRIRLDECNGAVVKVSGIAGLKAGANEIASAIGPVGDAFLRSVGKAGFNLDDLQNLPLLTALTDGLVGAMRDQGFDEQQELEADKLAVELMTRAGYNPEEYIAFLDKIPKGGGANLTHHPPNADRQAKLREFVKKLEKDPLLEMEERSLSDYAVVPLTDELAAAR